MTPNPLQPVRKAGVIPSPAAPDTTAVKSSSKQISERPEGYVIQGTGEVVAYSDGRLKNSPDGEYHWCSVAGADNSRTICLFVPPRSY